MSRARSTPASSGPLAIGIDVGGTKIAAGLVAVANGAVLSAREVPTPRREGGLTVLAAAHALALDLNIESLNRGRPAEAIGVSLCEIVDPGGTIRSSHAVAWEGLPVRERLAAIAPTYLEADVRAAALAESRIGAGRHRSVVLYVTIGTGISCCLVVNGVVHTGARGGAGTLATGPFPNLPPRNPPGPSLEAISSGPGLLASLQEAGGSGASGRDVLDAAEAGDGLAREIVETAGASVGAAIGWLVNILDPEIVILGGGVGLTTGRYRTALVESLRQHVWWPDHRNLPVTSAETGAQAGFIGAAIYAAAKARAQQLSHP